MLDGLSYPEIITWGAYYALDGWPDWRADVRAALICSVLANINRSEEQRSEPFGIEDFMIDWSTGIEKAKTQVQEEEVQPDEGAVVAPDVLTWLFAKAGVIDVLQKELEADAEVDSDGR